MVLVIANHQSPAFLYCQPFMIMGRLLASSMGKTILSTLEGNFNLLHKTLHLRVLQCSSHHESKGEQTMASESVLVKVKHK